MITRNHIEMLFTELWPMMPYSSENKHKCLEQFYSIESYFKKSADDDELLINLCSLPRIDLTIASGLIWSIHQDSRVPFDKYTLGYALQKKILFSNSVKGKYIRASEKIKEYCSERSNGTLQFKIEDFVREAKENLDPLLAIEPQ